MTIWGKTASYYFQVIEKQIEKYTQLLEFLFLTAIAVDAA
jgi:hypothetical protein